MIPYQACNMEWYISFLTTQSLDILMERARKHQSGCLKYPVCFALDNFRNNIYAPKLSICILCKETSEAKRLAAHNRELCSQFADVLRKVLQDAEYCAVCAKGEKPIYDCLYHADDLDRNGYKKRFKYNRIDRAEISKD